MEVLEESDSVFVSRHAAGALGNIGDSRAVPILTRQLRDSDAFVRLSAIDALGKIGDRAATQALIRKLKAPEDFVRGAAADALGEIGDERAVPALARALDDPDWSVRDSAAGALGEIGDPSANEFLISALSDRDWAVRGAVARALNETKWIPDMGESGAAYWAAVENWPKCLEIGGPALGPLSEALKLGTKESTRAGAAEALGTIGDPRAADSLVGALHDKTPVVRKHAAEALERLGWVPNRGTAGRAFWAAKGEWEKCAKIGLAAVKPLLRVLKEEREPVRREAAARTLGEIGDQRPLRLSRWPNRTSTSALARPRPTPSSR